MADGILGIIQRKNPDKEFDILKQIGSGTRAEVYKVSSVYTRKQSLQAIICTAIVCVLTKSNR